MSDILQADLDILHQLGGLLAGHADAIGQLKVTAAVTMPDSPVQDVVGQVGVAVIQAYKFIAGNVRQMSDAAHSTARSYEEFDQTFSNQLGRYRTGG